MPPVTLIVEVLRLNVGDFVLDVGVVNDDRGVLDQQSYCAMTKLVWILACAAVRVCLCKRAKRKPRGHFDSPRSG